MMKEEAEKYLKQVEERALGFKAVEVGPLKSARYLEPMAVMIIELGYSLKM
jgi:predicted dinucleotide-binding enzyme